MRIPIVTTLVLLAAAAAVAPTAQATCIDSSPDDNGVGTTNCNLPVAGNCHVLVYGELPGIGSGCSPVVCGVQECVPHLLDRLWPPYDCVQDCDGPPTE